jgi:hypothetical protein
VKPGHTGAVSVVLRTGLLAAIVVAALGVVGCSGSSRCTASASCPSPQAVATSRPLIRHASVISSGNWWQWGGVNCFPPAMVRVADRVSPVGDCAGLLVVPAKNVTLRVGEELEVHMFVIAAGFTSPGSSAPAVLRRVAVGPEGATSAYLGMHPGHAMLVSHGQCVGIRINGEIVGRCPVLDVTVVR